MKQNESRSCLQSQDSEDDLRAFRTDSHKALGTVHVSPPESSLSVFRCERSVASSSTVHLLGTGTVRRSSRSTRAWDQLLMHGNV